MFTDKKPTKEKCLPAIRVTEEQKDAVEKMAKERKITISKMILELLEIENKERRLIKKKN